MNNAATNDIFGEGEYSSTFDFNTDMYCDIENYVKEQNSVHALISDFFTFIDKVLFTKDDLKIKSINVDINTIELLVNDSKSKYKPGCTKAINVTVVTNKANIQFPLKTYIENNSQWITYNSIDSSCAIDLIDVEDPIIFALQQRSDFIRHFG
jgi:hypothetical protein